MTFSAKFNLHALGIEELELRILRDIKEHNSHGLPGLIEALFFKSLHTQVDGRRLGMEAVIPPEAGEALGACLTAFSDHNPQASLTLMTTLMRKLRGHYEQSSGIDTDPVRALLEDRMVPLLCRTGIIPPVRMRGFAELFSSSSYTPSRPSYCQAVEGAMSILNEEKVKPWLMQREISDHCVTLMNATSYYLEAGPEDDAEEKIQRFLAPFYAAALQEWKQVLQNLPVERAMEQAQPDRFTHRSDEIEALCSAVGDLYVQAHPDRLHHADFARAIRDLK